GARSAAATRGLEGVFRSMDERLKPGSLNAVRLAASEGMVGYFSMEIAIEPSMPTYSGGLGVLAGDTLRSAADMGLPLAAVTLVHRKGYFKQILDANGTQTEDVQAWSPEARLPQEEPRVVVTIEGRPVHVRAWRYDMEGVTGHTIPIYMLDTDLEGNDPHDRTLTDCLYGGDTNYRLAQEIVLGVGGLRMLDALGYDISVYHMNEGHAALLTLALLEKALGGGALSTARESDLDAVRQHCVFTTHTPVPAGHDRFSMEQANRILGSEPTQAVERIGGCHEGMVNLTYIALRLSRFVNGVAMQHGKVSRAMFPEYDIAAITNGVHAGTWTAPAMQAAFDKHLPRWREDNMHLRHAIDIPQEEIAGAHADGKRMLLAEVEKRSGVKLREDVFTIGFARRVATYKRGDLLFTDAERLAQMAQSVGSLQILYAGKAHPADEPGKQIIRHVFEEAQRLTSAQLHIIYLADYEWRLGALLTGGVDLWLNNPLRPYEASGTSGMKAALNGVPSLSVLDGWWIEGCVEGVTGWAIEDRDRAEDEAASLYDKLESKILPLYYQDKPGWRKLMQTTIAMNGSFFNTQRMLEQYVSNAYYPEKRASYSAHLLEQSFAR
ncbi:MAG TPA: alpha-glucan family phosphorylase, partial [Acidobacteriaceae bacterium]|nr:alpha-glucan family phosphorylase [Acidobacteriaceae bacterium]